MLIRNYGQGNICSLRCADLIRDTSIKKHCEVILGGPWAKSKVLSMAFMYLTSLMESA